MEYGWKNSYVTQSETKQNTKKTFIGCWNPVVTTYVDKQL